MASGKERGSKMGMNWKHSERLNKRPDGLSKIVAVRNVKEGEGGRGAARQQERGPFSLPQKWEERRGERKSNTDEKTVC